MEQINDVFSSTSTIVIDGKTYIIGKFDIGDDVIFRDFCDKKAQKEVIEACELLKREPTIKELREAKGDEEFRTRMISSNDGLTFILTIILKRLNKDVDEEYIKNNVLSINWQEVLDKIGDNEEEKKDSKNFPQKKIVKKAKKKKKN